jgi:hypothetical protein
VAATSRCLMQHQHQHQQQQQQQHDQRQCHQCTAGCSGHAVNLHICISLDLKSTAAHQQLL